MTRQEFYEKCSEWCRKNTYNGVLIETDMEKGECTYLSQGVFKTRSMLWEKKLEEAEE